MNATRFGSSVLFALLLLVPLAAAGQSADVAQLTVFQRTPQWVRQVPEYNALVDPAAVRAEWVVVVGVQPDAATRRTELAGHPRGCQAHDPAAGVGHGIFLYDIRAAQTAAP